MRAKYMRASMSSGATLSIYRLINNLQKLAIHVQLSDYSDNEIFVCDNQI